MPPVIPAQGQLVTVRQQRLVVTGIADAEWASAIRELLAAGQVEQQDTKDMWKGGQR